MYEFTKVPAKATKIIFSDQCSGYWWRDHAGFTGCLQYTDQPVTSMVGPFSTVGGVVQAIKNEYLRAEARRLGR